MDNTGSTDLAPDTVLVSDASYAPFGPVTGVRNGLQRRLTRGLDLNYAPTAIDSETPGGLGLRYTMDEVGNISRLASAASGRSAPRLDLEYDPLQRLTGAYAANGHGQAFGYTATGDRSEIAEVGFGPILPVDYAYAPGTHRLVAVGATARSVDAAGNTTSRGDGVGLAYDARNRLTQVTLPGGNTRYTYLYNGKGERVGKKKTLAGSPVGASYFVYDEGGRLLGEYTASGAAVAEYLYFNDALYAVATPTDLYYVETDHLGTPRTLVSSARQTVVWSWDALDAKGAFGASAPDADPDHDGVPMVFNLRFPGQYYDAETGLHYNYFRDYEPGTGRYVESDPVGLAGGLSTYGYVSQRPLRYVDPLGLWCIPFPDERTDWSTKKVADPNGTVQPWASVPPGIGGCIFIDAWHVFQERERRSKSYCRECLSLDTQCPGKGENCEWVWKYGLWKKERRDYYENIWVRGYVTATYSNVCVTCRNPFTGNEVTACEE